MKQVKARIRSPDNICKAKSFKLPERTGISVPREMTGPLHVRVSFMLARGDGEAADGREDGCVAEGGLGGDDAVGDVVFDCLCCWNVSLAIYKKHKQIACTLLPIPIPFPFDVIRKDTNQDTKRSDE